MLLAVNIAYFRDLFAGLALGPHGSLSLIGRDGAMLMRQPYDPKVIGRNIKNAATRSRRAAIVALEEPVERPAARQKPDRRSEKEKEIERKLSLPTTVNFDNAPLKQVIDDLRDYHGMNIVPDLPALQEAGISLESPVTIKLDGVPLKTASSATRASRARSSCRPTRTASTT